MWAMMTLATSLANYFFIRMTVLTHASDNQHIVSVSSLNGKISRVVPTSNDVIDGAYISRLIIVIWSARAAFPIHNIGIITITCADSSSILHVMSIGSRPPISPINTLTVPYLISDIQCLKVVLPYDNTLTLITFLQGPSDTHIISALSASGWVVED